MTENKYKFQPKQLFPINTNITTALSLKEDILTVTGTYPPTLNLFNIETYNMIFSRQLDYEIRKIEKIGDKLILLSDNYVEFHNMSKFIEKVQTKAIDFKYNPKDGRIYLVGNKGIEIIDFSRNIKLSNTEFNRNDQLLKIDILELGYVINNRLEPIDNLKNTIDIYDFRMALPNIITSKSTESFINSIAIKDPVRFYSLSEGVITEHDLRSSSVIKYSLNNKDLKNLKCFDNKDLKNLKCSDNKDLRNLKCFDGGLMFNNTKGVFYLTEFKSEAKIETLVSNEMIEDYLLKDGYLYLGSSDGVQIFFNEYLSFPKYNSLS